MKELTKVSEQTPANLMQIAVEKGADLDQLKALMELQERYEDREAKKLYTKAMAKFKATPPLLVKDQKVSFGKTNYNFANLGQISTKINTALSKHDLTASWQTTQDDRGITVTCNITHIAGYSESTSLTSPPDNSGNKNAIQGIGSAVTYLSRYTILALTGLSTSESDDDGVSSGYSEGKIQAIAVPVEKFIEGVNFFMDEKHSADDLDKWFSGKMESLNLLSEDDATKVEACVADMTLWLNDNGKHGNKKQDESKNKLEVSI